MKNLFFAVLLAAAAGAAARAEPGDTVFQTVVVKRGDTLWGIASAYLKDPAKWDEILKYNRLPSSDPTVALPGMTLRVPVRLIREDLRAAHMIYKDRRVDFRRKETADWSTATEGMELFKGDAVRTLEQAHARIKFLSADMLNVDPDSLVIIKPPSDEGDVVLKAGSIFTGHSRVVTASAVIVPKTKDTQYSTRISPDFTTEVAVHKGVAAVQAQGATVDVKAGQATEVKMGLAPEVPHDIPDLPDFEARAAVFNGTPVRPPPKLEGGALAASGAAAADIERAQDVAELKGEVASLRVGVPIEGYRVQASLSRDFDKVAFDKTFDADERLDMRYEKLPPGVYWFRIALIDLLGTQQKFSEPRLFSMGLGFKAQKQRVDLLEAVKIARPVGDQDISDSPDYKVVGVVKNDRVTVTVNGRPVRLDDSGNFSVDLRLRSGANNVVVVVSDQDGDSTTITRTVTFTR